MAGVNAVAQATDTHDEYIAQVNPICKSAARQAKKIPSQIRETGNPFIDGLKRSVLFGKLLGKTISRIAQIQPAPGEEQAVTAWLDEGRREVRLIRQVVAAVKHRKPARRVKVLIKKVGVSQRKGQARAAALGLTVCAGGRNAGP
jgi:hypothetical protein